jgi:NAD-dependent SIR2 family protein deacetylase
MKKKVVLEPFDCLLCGDRVEVEDIYINKSSNQIVKKCRKCRDKMYYNRVKERKARQEKFRQKWREYINESS